MQTPETYVLILRLVLAGVRTHLLVGDDRCGADLCDF